MGICTISFTLLVVLLMGTQEINTTSDGDEKLKRTTSISNVESNPLTTILDRNGIEDVNRSQESADKNLTRVKRQYGYDPYYNRRNRYPYPLPIFGGGGFGLGGFGGRGFGGRGFGGRGIGGRGIGGFGGRGIGGGGRGGGRG